LSAELVLLHVHTLDFSLQLEHPLGQLRHVDQSLLGHFDLTLILGDLYPDHPDLVLDVLDVHLGGPEYVLLDVALLIKDTEFVVPVDELYPREVAVLAGLLILLPQSLHVPLEGDDDHVQFLYLVSVLVDQLLLLLLLEVVFVQLRLSLVPLVHLQLQHVVVVLNRLVFLGRLVLQDFQLVLKDFYTLFQLSEVLGGILDQVHVFITRGFHLLV
jgi:hypothetical protein